MHTILLMMGCIFLVSSLIYASGTRVTINIIENPHLSGQNTKNNSISEEKLQTTGIPTGNISSSGRLPLITLDKENTNNAKNTTLISSKDSTSYPFIGNAKRIIKILKIRIEQEEKKALIESSNGVVLNIVSSSDSGFIERSIETPRSLLSRIVSFIRRSVLSYNYSFFETILATIKGYPVNVLSLTVFKTSAFTDFLDRDKKVFKNLTD